MLAMDNSKKTKIFGRVGPRFRFIPRLIQILMDISFTAYAALNGFHRPYGKKIRDLNKEFKSRLKTGETLYLVGIGPASHNSGVALVEVSKENGIKVLSNDEEERFSSIKHCDQYPKHSIDELKRRLQALNLHSKDIFAFLASWDYVAMPGFCLRHAVEHFPRSMMLNIVDASPDFNIKHSLRALQAPKKLAKQLGLKKAPIIGMTHHDNHAYFSFAVSPFANSDKPTMISVIDGFGDSGAISLYKVENHTLKCIHANDSMVDSLGLLYCIISSTQGGWTPLSSEGRYMGAAAWGNSSRLTNPFYKRLRQLLYFGDNGNIQLNRSMAKWHLNGMLQPYSKELKDILGEPIAFNKMWGPDAVLNVDNIKHSPITTERVDKAAALQLVFEDALFHIVEHLIEQSSGADQLVLTGGTALNCVANMHLMEHFNEEYYSRYYNKNTKLKLWIPPAPGDAGAVMGAPFNFAMRNGAKSSGSLSSPFICGVAPETSQIKSIILNTKEVVYSHLGNINESYDSLLKIADFMAYIVADDGIIGIYQGPAETGNRALGHRSILSNPCNKDTLDILNSRVKNRERVRPLAPMVTEKSAYDLFKMAEGASADNYNAYDYMVLTVPAKKETRKQIPAVVHHDGTCRIQIVREENNALIYHYLQAMGKRTGCEVSVNTSLNVGSPIVQTPDQAVEVLFRAKALDGLIMVGDDGETYAVWSEKNNNPMSASRLPSWYCKFFKKSFNQT